ncbi:MAG: outer membrane protein assembly factor BamE [Nitrosomonas sp.]
MHVKFLLLSIVSLSISCSYLPSLPYKIDIQQGNVVTEDMVEKLRLGMTRSQVRFVLGSPLITDVFHINRWDYVYSLAPSGRLSEKRRLSVFFDGDLLTHIEGDFKLPILPANDLPLPSPNSTDEVPEDDEKKNEDSEELQPKEKKEDKKGTTDMIAP